MSVVEELQCCGIGILMSKEEECHKLSIVESKSLIPFGTFSQENLSLKKSRIRKISLSS